LRTDPADNKRDLASASGKPVSSITMVVPRAINLWLVNCMSIILLSFTCPNRIITLVVIIFNTILVAVPAFIRVLPVTNSGPVSTSTHTSHTARIWLSLLHTTPPVAMPRSLHARNAPIT
jgi:hypothetical protein